MTKKRLKDQLPSIVPEARAHLSWGGALDSYWHPFQDHVPVQAFAWGLPAFLLSFHPPTFLCTHTLHLSLTNLHIWYAVQTPPTNSPFTAMHHSPNHTIVHTPGSIIYPAFPDICLHTAHLVTYMFMLARLPPMHTYIHTLIYTHIISPLCTQHHTASYTYPYLSPI